MNTNWEFTLGQEFVTPWGRNKGFMTKRCTLPAKNVLECDSEEKERGWVIKSTRTFSDEGFIESIDFTAGEKSVSTKKYYKTTTKEELEADR